MALNTLPIKDLCLTIPFIFFFLLPSPSPSNTFLPFSFHRSAADAGKDKYALNSVFLERVAIRGSHLLCTKCHLAPLTYVTPDAELCVALLPMYSGWFPGGGCMSGIRFDIDPMHSAGWRCRVSLAMDYVGSNEAFLTRQLHTVRVSQLEMFWREPGDWPRSPDRFLRVRLSSLTLEHYFTGSGLSYITAVCLFIPFLHDFSNEMLWCLN